MYYHGPSNFVDMSDTMILNYKSQAFNKLVNSKCPFDPITGWTDKAFFKKALDFLF